MSLERALGYLKIACVALSLAALGAGWGRAIAQVEQRVPIKAVPRASCGSGDTVETVQGETTLAERFATGPAKIFNCNLELVGQYKGQGSGWGWSGTNKCAYVTQYRSVGSPKLTTPGTLVLDVSNVSTPKLVTILDSPAMDNVNESMAISPDNKLLVGNNIATNGETSFPVEVYDISDCRNPKLLTSQVMPNNLRFHGAVFSADSKLLFGAACDCALYPQPYVDGSAVFAIDMSDPAHPKELARWVSDNENWMTHWISINKSGTRAYVTLQQFSPGPKKDGTLIFDISDFKSGKANPQFHLVGKLFWDDTRDGEGNNYFSRDGRDYLVYTDFLGGTSMGAGATPFAPTCIPGRATWGYPHVIDVTDAANPVTVSRLALEVDLPERCQQVVHDPVGIFGYGPAMCDTDNIGSARLLACGSMEAGLRVFDIRDPHAPKEVAYFKPAATRGEVLAASAQTVTKQNPNKTADAVVLPHFRDGGRQILFNAMDNGFMVVRFEDEFIKNNPGLFVAQ